MIEISLCEKYTLPEESIMILHGEPVFYPTDGDDFEAYVHCFFKTSQNMSTNRMIHIEDFAKFPQDLISHLSLT